MPQQYQQSQRSPSDKTVEQSGSNVKPAQAKKPYTLKDEASDVATSLKYKADMQKKLAESDQQQ